MELTIKLSEQETKELFKNNFVTIDNKYVITKDFVKEGVKETNIHFADICTCCNNQDFYSFRYKTMYKEKDYGCRW